MLGLEKQQGTQRNHCPNINIQSNEEDLINVKKYIYIWANKT